MKTFIPLEKRSKKEQKEYHSKQRGSWHGFNPVTRVVRNGKAYDRNREKAALRRGVTLDGHRHLG